MAQTTRILTTQTTRILKRLRAHQTSTLTEDYAGRDDLTTDAKLVYLHLRNYLRDPRNTSAIAGGRTATRFDSTDWIHSTHIPWHELRLPDHLAQKYNQTKLFIGAPFSTPDAPANYGIISPNTPIRHGGSIISRFYPGRTNEGLEYHLARFPSLHPNKDIWTREKRYKALQKEIADQDTFGAHLHEWTHVHQMGIRNQEIEPYDLSSEKSYHNHPAEKEAFSNQIRHKLERAVWDNPHANHWNTLNRTEQNFMRNVDQNTRDDLIAHLRSLKRKKGLDL